MKRITPLLSLVLLLFTSCNNKPVQESSEPKSEESPVSESSIEETSSEEQSYEESESESESEIESTSSIESESEIDPIAKYYESVDTSSLASIKSTLQTLMFKTHTKYLTYGEIRYLFKYSDADPNVSGNILCFYSRKSMNGTWDQGKTYNREHVWPKAKSAGLYNNMGSDTNYKGPGSDLHHIRPTDVDVNTARGSSPFGQGGYMPEADVRGDCARIIMYMYVHYCSYCNGQNVKSDYVAELMITSVFKSIDELKQWNQDDPVDDLERARNEYVYKKQGNRNPFIDHPEWVKKCLL